MNTRKRVCAPKAGEASKWISRPAICIQPRDGKLFVFLPALEYLADYLDLVAAIEDTAHQEMSRTHTVEWRNWLTEELTKLGLKVTPSVANFDGAVTAADYSAIDNGFAFTLTDWTNGDFILDNVDAQDKPTRYVMGQSPGTHWYSPPSSASPSRRDS